MALYVSCRMKNGSSLSVAMKTELQAVLNNCFRDASGNFVEKAKTSIPTLGTIAESILVNNGTPFKSFGALISAVLDRIQPEDAVVVFTELAENKGKCPVLILDEANAELELGAVTDGNSPPTTAVLDCIVQLTKQDKRLTVFLASAEYAYPYKLENIGLNLEDLTGQIFVGELPPNKMYELLTRATYEKEVTLADGTVIKEGETIVGMGPNLATLFMSAYGGHFFQMTAAMNPLLLRRDEFALRDSMNILSSEIHYCLHSNNITPGGMSGMVSLLESMAVQGYAMLDYRENPNAVLISLKKIGGIVEQGNTIVGLPEATWQTTTSEYALVPTSQSARLIILKELLVWKRGNIQSRGFFGRNLGGGGQIIPVIMRRGRQLRARVFGTRSLHSRKESKRFKKSLAAIIKKG